MITDERLRELAMMGLEIERKQIDAEMNSLRNGNVDVTEQRLSRVGDLIKRVEKLRTIHFETSPTQKEDNRAYMRTPAMRRRISLAMKRRWAERRRT